MKKNDPKKSLLALAFIGVGLSLVGCATPVIFTRVSKNEYPAKLKNCEFNIQSIFPSQGFEEIGTINLGTDVYGQNHASDLSKFKSLIHEQVCLAGADLVVPDINGKGFYVRAIVFKQIP